MPQIFIALENPPFSAGFEPMNLGSNDNHYTAENNSTALYRHYHVVGLGASMPKVTRATWPEGHCP
jgi:hypothetical protein